MLKAKSNSKHTKLTVIFWYAPTEEADEEKKDVFYKQLQAATQDVPTHDMSE